MAAAESASSIAEVVFRRKDGYLVEVSTLHMPIYSYFIAEGPFLSKSQTQNDEGGHISTKWGPQTIAKLVNITPITMVYGSYNYSYWGL